MWLFRRPEYKTPKKKTITTTGYLSPGKSQLWKLGPRSIGVHLHQAVVRQNSLCDNIGVKRHLPCGIHTPQSCFMTQNACKTGKPADCDTARGQKREVVKSTVITLPPRWMARWTGGAWSWHSNPARDVESLTSHTAVVLFFFDFAFCDCSCRSDLFMTPTVRENKRWLLMRFTERKRGRKMYWPISKQERWYTIVSTECLQQMLYYKEHRRLIGQKGNSTYMSVVVYCCHLCRRHILDYC